MALTVGQFRKILEADERKLADGAPTVGVGKCHKCKIPLQEAITGNRPVVIGRKTRNFCSDCYFEKMARELDDYPIYMPRIRRG